MNGVVHASVALHRAGTIEVRNDGDPTFPASHADRFHECLFRVCPKLANKHQQELDQLLKKRNEVCGCVWVGVRAGVGGG